MVTLNIVFGSCLLFCDFLPIRKHLFSRPERRPVLLLLLTHERTDVHTLAQLEASIPQQHVHSVKVKVRVRHGKTVEEVRKTSHAQCRLSRAKGDLAALPGSIVVLLLIEAVEHFLDALEELNYFVESFEVVPHLRDIDLGQLQVVEGWDGELGEKGRLHTERQHIAELGVEDLLIRRQTALGLLILGSPKCVDSRDADVAQHRDGCAVEVVGDRVGHSSGRSTEAGWWGRRIRLALRGVGSITEAVSATSEMMSNVKRSIGAIHGYVLQAHSVLRFWKVRWAEAFVCYAKSGLFWKCGTSGLL